MHIFSGKILDALGIILILQYTVLFNLMEVCGQVDMFQLDFQLLQVTIECPRQGTGQQKICILIDEESITCHKRRYIVLPMKANNTIWSNITLQKSCKKVRAQQEAFLHISCVFLFILVGFHVTLKRNYCLYFLKVINSKIESGGNERFPASHTILPSIFTAKLYLVQTK